MARYLTLRTAADVERRLEAGRGRGHGKGYLPWFYVHEVPSRGRSHKVYGLVSGGRQHHLLSDLEWYCLVALEFIKGVLDIREQFPILPYGSTVPVAQTLGIRHPIYAKGVPRILTSDFCVDLPNLQASNGVEEVTIACKYKKDIQVARTRELLHLECVTNQALGRRWYLVDEDSFPRTFRRNLFWLRQGAFAPPELTSSLILDEFTETFLATYDPGAPLIDLLNLSAVKMRMTFDQVAWQFKFAAWNHLIEVDVFEPIGFLNRVALNRGQHHALSIIPVAA